MLLKAPVALLSSRRYWLSISWYPNEKTVLKEGTLYTDIGGYKVTPEDAEDHQPDQMPSSHNVQKNEFHLFFFFF